MSRAPAYLEILQPPAAAGGKPASSGEKINFTFNPKEFTLKRSASYEVKPGKKEQPPEYKGAEPGSVSVEVFLDRELCGDVANAVAKLFACLDPVKKNEEKNPSPPYVRFGWGKLEYLTGVVKSVSAKYTLFDPEGNPLRAVCTVDLQSAKKYPGKTNPTSGGLTPRHAHTVSGGDSLMSIAYDEYGDPSYWRAVAAANGIDDPLRLRPGAVLLLPIPDDAVALR